MLIDHIISEIYYLRIWETILIGDNTILLDYIHWFMGSLDVVDSRSQTLICFIIIYIGYWSAVDSL